MKTTLCLCIIKLYLFINTIHLAWATDFDERIQRNTKQEPQGNGFNRFTKTLRGANDLAEDNVYRKYIRTLQTKFLRTQYYDDSQNMIQAHGRKRAIAFVHIGKTGGTSVSLMIRRRCFAPTDKTYKAKCKEEEFLKRDMPNESEISRQVKEYFHGRRPDVSKYTSFIVTARDPIDRVVSAYLFENLRTFLKSRCYKNIDDLVTIGLRLPKKIDGELDYCQWLAFQSTRGACNCPRGNKDGMGRVGYHQILHAHANYQYYVGELLQHDDKEIFILRSEELSDDWKHLNKLLGGTEKGSQIEKYTHRSVGEVQNRTMSSEGIQNLCYVLCEEIQLYRKLILRAKNLDESAKYNSLRRLGSRCPYEINVDSCPPVPKEIFGRY